MHILMCNERFLFRFGVDRVLLIMAKYLRDRGHKVTIMGITMDLEIAKSVADHVIQIPSNDDYYNINEHVNDWLIKNWDRQFKNIETPDLVLNCGWPFFVAIPFMASKTKGVIFHDYGIVPVYEYEGGTLKIQEKVRELRKQYMRYCSYVITISDYVTKTTYEILEEFKIPVKTVHLGTDHMEMGLWSEENVAKSAKNSNVKNLIEQLHAQGKQVILNLGRWETRGYKNSVIMFDVVREIKKTGVNCVLLTLANQDMFIPEDLKDSIIPLGFISDEELICAMKNSDLGIAPTLWEGFNLPLSEMQFYHKPVLVFNIGAHPEVVIHPWYLCNDENEMIYKAHRILTGNDLPEDIRAHAYRRFRNYFTWDNCTKKCYEVFKQVLAGKKYEVEEDIEYVHNAVKTVSVIMDMTNPSRDPANPGIIRVCRRLAAQFQNYIDPLFVIWSEPDKGFVLPTRHEYAVMGTYHGPVLLDENKLSPDEYRIHLDEYLKKQVKRENRWVFLPDIVFMDRGFYISEYCKKNKFLLADIFYDDIPYKLTDIYEKEVQDRHAQYMMRLSESDFVSSISQYSTDCLMDFYEKLGITEQCVKTVELPGEFNAGERVKEYMIPESETVQFLCVSTLEPRKNHRVLIDACLKMEEKYPDVKYKLVMIGNKYPGHFDIAEYAENVSKKNPNIQWIGIVDDETMKRVVKDSTFTVYPSKMEGYGLPIMESIWQGKPCLCYGEGAMGELASGGGCYTADVNSVDSMCEALHRLCTDKELIKILSKQAVERTIITWDEYTLENLKALVYRENFLNGIMVPDRKFGKQGIPVSNMEYCGLQKLVEKSNSFCSVCVGVTEPEIIYAVAENSRVTFSVNSCLPYRPHETKNANVLNVNGDAAECINDINSKVKRVNEKIGCICISITNDNMRIVTDIVHTFKDNVDLIVICNGQKLDCESLIGANVIIYEL